MRKKTLGHLQLLYIFRQKGVILKENSGYSYSFCVVRKGAKFQLHWNMF